MTADQQRYVPAAGRAAFLGAYDRVVALTLREPRWRPRLAGAVLDGLDAGATVVDVGAGTGAVTIELVTAHHRLRTTWGSLELLRATRAAG